MEFGLAMQLQDTGNSRRHELTQLGLSTQASIAISGDVFVLALSLFHHPCGSPFPITTALKVVA